MTWKGWSFCRTPEHAISEETWNGGDGKIRFNYVQQTPQDFDPGGTTDPVTDVWGIADDIYRGPSAS